MENKNKINLFLNQQKELFGNLIFSSSLIDVSKNISALNEVDYSKKNFEQYKNSISLCQECLLGETRKNFIFGSGDYNADLMLIGDFPGMEEDNQGEPFVGREGKLLDKILSAIGKSRRKGVYLTNILKCHIPSNRNPLLSEIAKCEPYILKQIEFIKPKVIVALGKLSGKILLKIDASLKEMRQNVYTFNGIPLKVTHHPAALLRSPDFKKDTWEDFKWVKTVLSN